MSEAVRYAKRTEVEAENEAETETIGALRGEAKELGINSFGLNKQALKASIAAVQAALQQAKPAPEIDAGIVAENADDPFGDENGEALGPSNIRRIPMGTLSARLRLDPRPGFYRRWLNDVPGRIERAKAAGYTFIMGRDGQPKSAPAGTLEQGGGMRAYAMELPMHLREEDLEAKSAKNDEVDRALNRGSLNAQPDDKTYVPDTGIRMVRAGRRL
jgi:hypothetical protein